MVLRLHQHKIGYTADVCQPAAATATTDMSDAASEALA